MCLCKLLSITWMQQPVHRVTHVYRTVFDTHSVASLGAEARVVCAVLMSCNPEATVESGASCRFDASRSSAVVGLLSGAVDGAICLNDIFCCDKRSLRLFYCFTDQAERFHDVFCCGCRQFQTVQILFYCICCQCSVNVLADMC